jgi:small-conductance mechanosensitive channel
MDLLQQVYWGNTLLNYCISALIILVGLLLLQVIKRIVLNRLQKWVNRTDNKADDFLVAAIRRSLVPVLYAIVIFIALGNLNLPPKWDHVIKILFSLCVTVFIIRAITNTLQFLLTGYLSKQENGEEKTRQVRGIMVIISAVIWIIGILFLLNNWGVNVTTFVAGLGIGGIAIALAAQTILGDLFSYFVIFFDRPFEIGDFIIVQDKMGTVEYIGIKTTRLRSLSGEQLVFSNTDLTNSRVHNYKRMETRRIVFKFGVIYDTPKEKLAKIPVIIKDIITRQEGLRFDRAHFLNFADFQLEFEVVYIVLTGDYNKYMDYQQVINLEMFDIFAKEGIEFAFPTRTVIIQNPEKKGIEEGVKS